MAAQHYILVQRGKHGLNYGLFESKSAAALACAADRPSVTPLEDVKRWIANDDVDHEFLLEEFA